MAHKTNPKPENRERSPIEKAKKMLELLWRGPLALDFGKKEIKVLSRNGKKSAIVSVPPQLIPKIKRVLNSPGNADADEVDRVFPYILQIAVAMEKIDLLTSTSTEKHLKKAFAKEFHERKWRKDIEEQKEKKE